jgi:organic hydroperoxide reductase OsmC/OhrA
MLIAALAQCHLLSYLYVAVANGIVVEDYQDAAEGVLVTTPDGAGRFREVVLRPVVTISAGDPEVAQRIHADANRLCFIASSVNFPVRHEPTVLTTLGA